jgi:hypothetical protein
MMTLIPKPGDPLLKFSLLMDVLKKPKLVEFVRRKKAQKLQGVKDEEDEQLQPALVSRKYFDDTSDDNYQVCNGYDCRFAFETPFCRALTTNTGVDFQTQESTSPVISHSALLAPVAPSYQYGSTPPRIVKLASPEEVARDIAQLEELWKSGFIQREEYERRMAELLHLRKSMNAGSVQGASSDHQVHYFG